MEQSAEQVLAIRVERLERLLKATVAASTLALIAVILVAVGLWLASKRPVTLDTLRAHRLEIVDANGALRAVIKVQPDGSALEMLDTKGATRIELGVDIEVGMDTRGTALTFLDSSGAARTGLVATTKDTSLGLYAPGGGHEAGIVVQRLDPFLGRSYIALFDGIQDRAIIKVDDRERTPKLLLYNEFGTPIFKVP